MCSTFLIKNQKTALGLILLAHSSCQICSRSFMLVGCLVTAIFKQCHRVVKDSDLDIDLTSVQNIFIYLYIFLSPPAFLGLPGFALYSFGCLNLVCQMKFANRATNSLDIDLTPVEHSPRLHCLGLVVGTFVLQEGGSFQAYIFTYLFIVYSIADRTFFLYIYPHVFCFTHISLWAWC